MGNDNILVPTPKSVEGSRLASPSYAPSTITMQPIPPSTEFDWENALRVLHKNWRLSLVFACTVFAIVTIMTFRMKDIYEPAARVEIDPPGSDTFSLKDLLNSQSNDQDYLQTQAQILQSDELTVAVIRTLGLDRNPDLVGKEATDAEGEAYQEAPSANQLTPLENVALRAFKQRLNVNQLRNSRLAEVSFSSHDAELAALVTNTLVNLYIDRNYRTRYETTMQASEWLEGQLSDLRQKVQQSNKALVDYQRTHEIVDLGDRENPLSWKVIDVNRQAIQAQADRIALQAYLNMAQSGAMDTLPQFRDNWVYIGLTQRLAEMRTQLAQTLVVYGKNHPSVKRLQTQVDEMAAQINAEKQKAIEQLKTSYEAAVRREKLSAEAVETLRGSVTTWNEDMIQYTVLKHEALANLDLYNTLLTRLKEAGIAAGLRSSNIRVVDQARVLDKPTRPHRLLNMVIGLIMGIAGGVALAFLKEKFDNTIRTPDDVKQLTGLSSLAMFPLVSSVNGHERKLAGRQSRELGGDGSEPEMLCAPKARFFLEKPSSPEAEAVRNLHTSIALSRPGRAPRTILIVSPAPGEGKSTVALNLAAALAEHGKTCLVDADLRRPMVARSLNMSPQQGLSHVLTGSAPLEAALQTVPDYPNLVVLPVGVIPPNPGELVASAAMQEVLRRVREMFQYVVIDSPPVIPFADARALSPLADGVVLVGRAGATTRQSLIRSKEILREVHAHIVGVVLNAVDLTSPDFSYYQYGYGYGHAHAYAYGDQEQQGEDGEGYA